MNSKFCGQKNNGSTLFELMVSIAVGSILLLTALYVLRDFFKTQKTSQRLTQLQSASERILNDLTQEVHWSNDFLIDGSSLSLSLGSGEEVVFLLQNQILYKDGQPTHPSNIKVTKFDVKNRAPAGPIGCLQITLNLEHAGKELPITTMEKQTTISLRKSKLGNIK